MKNTLYAYVSKNKWIYFFALICIAYLFGPIFCINGTLVFNTDEYGLAFDVLNRVCGLPVEYSAWPGGTIQFLSYPFVLASIGVKSIVSGLTIDSFAKSYAAAYFNLDYYISIIRFVNTFVFFSVIFWVFTNLIKSVNDFYYQVCYTLFFILFITNSEINICHWTATAESIAVSFTFLALYFLLLCDGKYNDLFSGFFLGLAIACKITFIINAPFFLVALLIKNKNAKLKSVLSFVLCSILAFIIVCPYIWTDTLRLFKSIGGNFHRSGNPMGIMKSMGFMSDVVSVLSLGLFSLLLFLNKKKQNVTLWVVVFLLGLMNLYLGGTSGVFYSRYFLPITVLVLFFLLYSVPTFVICIKNTKYAKVLIILLLLAVCVQSVMELNKTYNIISQKRSERREINELKKELVVISDAKKVLVPFELIYELVGICNSETFSVMLSDIENNNAAFDFYKTMKISESSYNSLKFALSDEEISLQHRLGIYKWNTMGQTNIIFYSNIKAQNQRFALNTKDELLKQDMYILSLKDKHFKKIGELKVLRETAHYILYRN